MFRTVKHVEFRSFVKREREREIVIAVFVIVAFFLFSFFGVRYQVDFVQVYTRFISRDDIRSS